MILETLHYFRMDDLANEKILENETTSNCYYCFQNGSLSIFRKKDIKWLTENHKHKATKESREPSEQHVQIRTIIVSSPTDEIFQPKHDRK